MVIKYYRETHKNWDLNPVNKLGVAIFVWKLDNSNNRTYMFYDNKWLPSDDGSRLHLWLKDYKYDESHFEEISEKEAFIEML